MNTETVAEPKPPRQIADDIERYSLTVQVEANRISSLAYALRDFADVVGPIPEPSRDALGRIIDLVELIDLQAVKLRVCGEVLELRARDVRGDAA